MILKLKVNNTRTFKNYKVFLGYIISEIQNGFVLDYNRTSTILKKYNLDNIDSIYNELNNLGQKFTSLSSKFFRELSYTTNNESILELNTVGDNYLEELIKILKNYIDFILSNKVKNRNNKKGGNKDASNIQESK